MEDMDMAPGFREAERTGWSGKAGVPDAFPRRGAMPAILDAAGLRAAITFPDLGGGAGAVVATAISRGADATAIDLAAPMGAEARRHHPVLPFSIGGAEAVAAREAALGTEVARPEMMTAGTRR